MNTRNFGYAANKYRGRFLQNGISSIQILAYGSLMLPLSLGWVMLVMLVPTYYGDTLGVGLGVAGTVIAVGRVFDIGTDFVIGWLSDRFRFSRLGRKFWIAIGLPLFCVAFALLLLPPPDSGAFYLAIVCLFYFFSYTLVEISHSAIGLELSDNNANRNSLAASKSLFLVGGGLLGAALPSIFGGPSEIVFGYLVTICGCLSLVILPLFLLLVPENKNRHATALPKIRDAIYFVRNSKPLLLLLAVFFLVQTGSAYIGSFSFPYAAHVLGLPEKSGIFWLAAGVGFLLGVPVWLLVMNRLGRVLAWSLSLGLMLPVFIGLMMLGTGDLVPMLALSSLVGVIGACDAVVIFSLLASLVHMEERSHGKSLAGSISAVRYFITKTTIALPLVTGFPLLGAIGFESGGISNDLQVAAIVGLYAGVPLVTRFLALLTLIRSAKLIQNLG